MQYQKSPPAPLSYKELSQKASISSSSLLSQIKLLKPHMLPFCQTLLRTAPVSLYLYLQSLKSSSPSTVHSTPTVSETKLPLPKSHPIIFQQQQQDHNSMLLSFSLLDRSSSCPNDVRLDTSQTDHDTSLYQNSDFYTLNIFWKKTPLDLRNIKSPILAFLLKGMDLIYANNSTLLLDLQEKFLKMNLSPILAGTTYLEDSEEISLFREQPILPKKLLLDFIEKLEKSSTLELVEKYSVVKDILEIWMVALLREGNGGVMPQGEELFKRMGELFELHTVALKGSYRFGRGKRRFQVSKGKEGGWELEMEV